MSYAYAGRAYYGVQGVSGAGPFTLSFLTNASGSPIADGDLVFITFTTQGSNAASWRPTITTPGWVEVIPWASAGNHSASTWAKVRTGGETQFTYTQTGSTGSPSWRSVWFRPTDVTLDAISAGVYTPRATSGSSTTCIATSRTPDGRPGFALAFATERTTATETEAQITVSGTGWTKVLSDVSVDQSFSVAMKALSGTTATGPVTFTYPNVQASNAQSGQLLIYEAPVAVGPGPTGNTKAGFFPNFGQTMITLGILFAAVETDWEVQVKQGATVITTIVGDATSARGYGTITATGLSPNTDYTFQLIIEDVVQTDAVFTAKTLKAAGTPQSFKFLAGSCQATGSNHVAFDRMAAVDAEFLCHMGDMFYADPTTQAAWVTAFETSMLASRFKSLVANTPMSYIWDNHDRIIVDTLNLGTTDAATLSTYRELAGTSFPQSNSQNRTWAVGRVRFMHTDAWSRRDDPDGTLTVNSLFGSTQHQWIKDTLTAATEPLIVWFASFPNHNVGNGRWNSFPAATADLISWINARPSIKERLVMVGGDSHYVHGDSGSKATNQNFAGVPSLNASGFAMGGALWGSGTWDIVNVDAPSGGGVYHLFDIVDNGVNLIMTWTPMNGNNNPATPFATYVRRIGTLVIDGVPAVANHWIAAQNRYIPVSIEAS